MDEKGIKKLRELIEILAEFKSEGKFGSQGFNDRLLVAREIYHRNIEDKDFKKVLTQSFTDEMEDIFDLVK